MALTEQMRSILEEHSLVEGMNEDELDLLLQIGEEKSYLKDEVIIRKGEFSDKLYFIHEGGILFSKSRGDDPSQLQTYLLQAPGTFGESCFLHPSLHHFDVIAYEENTHLYSLRRQELENHPLGLRVLNKLLLNLIRLDLEGSHSFPILVNQDQQREIETKEGNQLSLKHLIEQAVMQWLPKNWNSRARKEIEKLFDIRHLSAQEICVKQNETVECCCLLVEGQLNVLEWDDVQNHHVLVDTLHPGDHFGEISLLDLVDSPYTIQAHTSSTLLILEGEKIDACINEKVIQKLLDTLEDRESDDFIWKNENAEIPFSIPIVAHAQGKEESEAKEDLTKRLSISESQPTLVEKKEEVIQSISVDALPKQRDQQLKHREEAAIYVRNQQLTRKKSFWIFSLVGLILSSLEPYQALDNLSFLAISLVQIFTPLVWIHLFLHERLKNWGWNKRFFIRSLLQAVACIAIVGGSIEVMHQIADFGNFRFFSLFIWDKIAAFSLSSIAGYFFFVAIQEWLRRGVVALSLQRGLESKKGWETALFSSLLFIGFSAPSSPLFALALIAKDFLLTQFFLSSPHVAGVIFLHFILGLVFASLGWFAI